MFIHELKTAESCRKLMAPSSTRHLRLWEQTSLRRVIVFMSSFGPPDVGDAVPSTALVGVSLGSVLWGGLGVLTERR